MDLYGDVGIRGMVAGFRPTDVLEKVPKIFHRRISSISRVERRMKNSHSHSRSPEAAVTLYESFTNGLS